MTPSLPAALTDPPVARDRWSREIRFAFAPDRTVVAREGDRPDDLGVYGLSVVEQKALLLHGNLPSMGLFLPDFAIVLVTGETITGPDGAPAPRWTDLRVHVGGLQWPKDGDPAEPITRTDYPRQIASCEWHTATDLIYGIPRNGHLDRPAPAWLLTLIRDRSPFGFLLDAAEPTWIHESLAARKSTGQGTGTP